MKAIETVYRGYRFRSRLEARWAVFFDALKIAWEYEPEGYHLSDGSMYLPDFWLPMFNGTNGTYVEVKPAGGDITKASRFARDSGVPVFLAIEAPERRVYECVVVDVDHRADAVDGVVRHSVSFDSKYLPGGSHGREYRFFSCPGQDDLDDANFISAVHAARQARFEHGQVGAPHEWSR